MGPQRTFEGSIRNLSFQGHDLGPVVRFTMQPIGTEAFISEPPVISKFEKTAPASFDLPQLDVELEAPSKGKLLLSWNYHNTEIMDEANALLERVRDVDVGGRKFMRLQFQILCE